MDRARPKAEEIEVLARQTVFQGFFRIDRYRLRIPRFDGKGKLALDREVFERGHAAAVLLYDAARDRVGLVEQFRPGAMAAGVYPWLIETVAGIVEAGETPERVAARETEEEAGVKPLALHRIGDFMVSPGGASESVRLFCARVDSHALDGLHGLAEEGEDIRVLSLPAEEAIALVDSGGAVNAITVIALQWLALHRAEIRKMWGVGGAEGA